MKFVYKYFEYLQYTESSFYQPIYYAPNNIFFVDFRKKDLCIGSAVDPMNLVDFEHHYTENTYRKIHFTHVQWLVIFFPFK